MPPLVRFYIKHALIGYALAAVFVALLFLFNVADLWGLVVRSDVPLLATFLLWFFNGIVMAGAQVGIAIMMMAEKPPSNPGGKRVRATSTPALIPARAPRKSSRVMEQFRRRP